MGQNQSFQFTKHERYVPPNRDEISEETRTATAAAAAAALSRFEQKNCRQVNATTLLIKAQTKNIVETELKLKAEQAEATKLNPNVIEEHSVKKRNLNQEAVYFRCSMISDEKLTKQEWKIKIKDFLYKQLVEEPALTSCLMIWNCNTKDKAAECINTLAKYLENMIKNPGEEKYFKIRMSNKVFNDKVRYVEGALEFLQATGFREVETDGELFLLWSRENMEKDFDLPSLLESLKYAEVIPLTLDRNLKVLLPSQIHPVDLPDEFYCTSLEDYKRVYQDRVKEAENAQLLRTKAMRERDVQRNLQTYCYTLIRVKFPNGICIQGTFNACDTLREIFTFVRSCLEDENLVFALKTAGNPKFVDQDMNKTLSDLRLIPSILLLFISTGATGITDFSEVSFLKKEVLSLVQDM